MSEIVKQEDASAVAQPDAGSLMEVISRAASDPNTDVDKLERLMGLYERITERQAKQAFDDAMNTAQQAMPKVVRNSENSHTKSHYADLEAVSNAIDPVAHKHGFSLSYGTAKSDLQGHYRITCQVSHNGGWAKDFFADIPADSAGAQGKTNKNATQAFGSTMTYGRRYLKCMIFDVKTGENDDDGLAGSKAEIPRMSADRGKKYINFQAILTDIENASDRVLTNLQTWIEDECGWMPSGWQNKLLERIKERDEEAENRMQEAVSANDSLDRQFKDTVGDAATFPGDKP